MALFKLGKEKGYDLVGCDSRGINAFFIRSSIAKDLIKKSYSQMYKFPQYGSFVNGKYIGHPTSDKKMITV